MIYLTRIIFFLLISSQVIATENKKNEILFKINDKVFTNVDLEKRIEYVALLNDLKISEINRSEIKEILDDYISSLVFYEYYIQKKKTYKNLNDEIDLFYKKNLISLSGINKEKINNYKFNTNIDLIRNKIIEEELNSKKENLLQEVGTLDLLYNYNLQHIIIKEGLINKELIKKVDDKKKFNNLKKYLKDNKINFFYKNENINDYTVVSNKIKKIINQNILIYKNNENGFISMILIDKNLESYEGIFVKLINFTTKTPFEKKDLQCNRLNKNININKTIFKEYEYSKLNNNIKNNLKSINDYVQFNDNNEYNYIILCDLTYDEKLLKNINFNKNINIQVKRIQNNFLKKFKDEYNYTKIK